MKVLNQRGKKSISWFLVFFIIMHLTSCNYYYVKKLTRYETDSIENLKPSDKKMIIHAGEETFILSDFKIDSTFLSGNLSKIDSSWYFYKENNSKTRFKNKEKEITKEVHFYLKEERINPAYTEIPLNNIKEIHVIFYDNEKSFVRSVVAVGGIIALSYYVIVYGGFILFYGA